MSRRETRGGRQRLVLPFTNEYVEELLRVGYFMEAQEQLEQMAGKGETADVALVNKVLAGHFSRGRLSNAVTMMRDIREYKLDANDDTSCIFLAFLTTTRRSSTDDLLKGLGLLQEIKAPISSNTFSQMLWKLIMAQRLDDARTMLGHASRFTKVDLGLVTTVVNGYLNKGAVQMAISLVMSMRDRFAVQPTHRLASLVVRCEIHNEEPMSALNFLQNVYESFQLPTASNTMKEIMKVLWRRKERALMEALLNGMEDSFGCRPDFGCAVPLLDLFIETAYPVEFVACLRELQTIPDVSVDMEWMNKALYNVCVAGKLYMAEYFLVELDLPWSAKSFTPLIREASTYADLHRMNQYFALMKCLNVRADLFCWNCLLRVEYNINGSTGRKKIMRRMIASGVGSDSYTRGVMKFTKSRKPSQSALKRKRMNDSRCLPSSSR